MQKKSAGCRRPIEGTTFPRSDRIDELAKFLKPLLAEEERGGGYLCDSQKRGKGDLAGHNVLSFLCLPAGHPRWDKWPSSS